MHRYERPRERARVLVIDDEYGARLQVELALATSGSVEIVGEASKGARGAELAEELQLDIVILDLSMPVMDGFEALPLIRTIVPHAVILIRSSNDDPAAFARALELGATTSIPKMLAPDDLRRMVERHVPAQTPIQSMLVAALADRAGRPAHTLG